MRENARVCCPDYAPRPAALGALQAQRKLDKLPAPKPLKGGAREESLRKLVIAAALVLAFSAEASAQDSIKIGLIMPLTGNAASAGQQSKAAVELAAEIVNNAHPELGNLPLAASAGLPNLKGAKPDAIQKALQQTDLKPEQLMMGYRGVKFDETGQNELAATYLIQLQGTHYVAVWPEKSAAAKLVYPFKGWQ